MRFLKAYHMAVQQPILDDELLLEGVILGRIHEPANVPRADHPASSTRITTEGGRNSGRVCVRPPAEESTPRRLVRQGAPLEPLPEPRRTTVLDRALTVGRLIVPLSTV